MSATPSTRRARDDRTATTAHVRQIAASAAAPAGVAGHGTVAPCNPPK